MPPPPPGPPPPLHEESAAENEARCTSAVFRAFDFMDGLDSLRATPTPSSRPAPAETQQKKSSGPRAPPVAAKPYLSRPVPRESLPNAESRRFGACFLCGCRVPHAACTSPPFVLHVYLSFMQRQSPSVLWVCHKSSAAHAVAATDPCNLEVVAFDATHVLSPFWPAPAPADAAVSC